MNKSRPVKAFPVVAIGASAGGLKAFEDLLNALPRNPGMAFVLVPHLAPQFKSHLAEILTRCTRLPVSEVRNGDKVQANRIYVVPPNRTMNIKGGTLHLAPLERNSGRHNPIDGFFRSVAEDQREKAIGVLLSGAGSDGTAGLQAIKERGGATFAQDGDTAAHLSMPHSAIVSGCVDFVLSPPEIGRRLGVGRVSGARAPGKPKAEETLNKILELLRAVKGVEFGLYKRTTLRRLIPRRMALKRVREPEKYLRTLKSNPEEVDQLFNDILICVTSFFREPESFRALKNTIYPRLLKGLPANTPIRLWVAGCSTGEEAYSHAMNLVEFLGKNAAQTPFQIFATDVNPTVIEKARAGVYTKKATAGVSPERLKRFFVETEDGYRIAPFLRERCIFAVHNLVQDPPFTSLDLISCRNLMIYLGPALQEKALQIFQYSLKPRGLLMLGRSETVGDFSGRFTPLDEKRKVFSVRTAATKARLDFTQPSRFLETDSAFNDAERGGENPGAPVPAVFDLQGQLDGVLPARYVPNGVIVNAELEILRFLGNTSPYLRPAPGKPGLNLRRMAAGEFLLELRAAIQAAKESACAVRKEVAAPLGGAPRRIHVEVLPVKPLDQQKDYFLVLFEEISGDEAEKRRGVPARPGKDNRRIIELKENLAVSGAHLKSIIDEQESTNARLKSSNESLLSSNEELQSINEEFETTKEELQSTNEELQSTNEELTTSTEEVVRGSEILSRANNDLSNLLANINIPVVLLDNNLTVHRFTPSAEWALGLSADKIGKSIVDMKLPLLLPDLKQLLVSVIKTGRVQTQEVQNAEGRWFYLIVRPYRTDKSKTQKSRTEGAVMALVDIQERKLAEKAVLRLATVVLDSNDSVIICDLKDRITAWNKGAHKMYGYTEKEALGMSIKLLMPVNKRIRARELVQKTAAPIETQRRARDGRIIDVLLTVTVLRDDRGQPVEVATTERDITAQKKSERDRKLAEKTISRLATVVLDSNDGVVVCDLGGRITAWNKGARKMYGYTEAQALGMSISNLMPKNIRFEARELVQKTAAPIETQRRTKAGRILDIQLTVTVLRDENGEPVEIAKTERDITAFKQAERNRKLTEAKVSRLATVVLDSNDAVTVCDLDDKITAWNKGAQKMYGYTEKQALGMSIRRLMPDNMRMKARDLVQKSAAPIETQRRTKAGRILDVLITVTVLRDDNGKLVEVATTERDITAQKKAERDRKIAEKTVLRLATVVLDSNDAVIICDLGGRITAWNKGAQKMYSYTESEALRMNIRRLMPKNSRISAQELIRLTGAPQEIQRCAKDGRVLDVLRTVTVLRDDKGRPVEIAKTERDITELKRADREFRLLHASVITAQETERKRLARELHDGVGQILSGVKFRLQALPGKMALSGDGEAKIAKVGGFLDHAIAEIRRVSQNLMPAELVDLGLGPALLTLCREFKERSGVRVSVRDEGAPQDLSPDLALALFRITQEALNNIGKHSKATMAGVNLARIGKELVLSVSDNGIGFKLGGERRTPGRGFGLGNMRQRAESVGGSIEVLSTPGAGTTLNVRAPLSGMRGYTS